MDRLRNLQVDIKKTNSLDQNGWLKIQGVATIADKVMDYIDYWEDKVTKEVIPLEELEKTKNDIVGIPITNDHPFEFVGNRNSNELVKGSVLKMLGIKNKEMHIEAIIYDANLILDIQAGKDQLSIGYYCDLEESSGVTENGERYDYIQRNIKYNHLAVVYAARAGEEAKITKFNSKEHDLAYSKGLNIKKINGRQEMAVFKLNGKDFTETELYQEAVRLNSEVETLKKTNSDLSSEKSRLEGELAVEKQNSQDAQARINGIEAEINAKINSKLALISQLKQNGFDVADTTLAESEIKRDFIKKNSAIDIDGKDDNFVEGVFEALIKNNAKEPVLKEIGAEKQNSQNTTVQVAWEKLRGGK